MEVLILHTVGRRSGQPRETPVSWYTDDHEGRLVVASGGGSQNPGWHANLMTHPDQASVELPGHGPVPVTPHQLDGADRERAWQRIIAARPQYEKCQSRTEWKYLIIRLISSVGLARRPIVDCVGRSSPSQPVEVRILHEWVLRTGDTFDGGRF